MVIDEINDILVMANKHIIQLNSGREIQLVTIYQWHTYTGLLEGLPTQEMNKGIVKGAINRSREWWSMKPYLIEPLETKIEVERNYPFGTPARIPGITCLARFECGNPSKDSDMDYSELAIIWFQSEFAFPIDELALDRIYSLEWEALAIDRDYSHSK